MTAIEAVTAGHCSYCSKSAVTRIITTNNNHVCICNAIMVSKTLFEAHIDMYDSINALTANGQFDQLFNPIIQCN